MEMFEVSEVQTGKVTRCTLDDLVQKYGVHRDIIRMKQVSIVIIQESKYGKLIIRRKK